MCRPVRVQRLQPPVEAHDLDAGFFLRAIEMEHELQRLLRP
jgi:hypothetical protein